MVSWRRQQAAFVLPLFDTQHTLKTHNTPSGTQVVLAGERLLHQVVMSLVQLLTTSLIAHALPACIESARACVVVVVWSFLKQARWRHMRCLLAGQ
jgi:hypothetical protein